MAVASWQSSVGSRQLAVAKGEKPDARRQKPTA